MERSSELLGGRVNSVNIAILLKAMCRFSSIHIKIFIMFFTETEKIPKFTWKHKRAWVAQAILSANNNAEWITTPAFKL